ncbi:MAG: hypothetical protein M1113_02915 [Candidatus Thermoplasmatota archaeon]|nr:hypothetical protein [Candidatus Thermoplasmatota archaeon]
MNKLFDENGMLILKQPEKVQRDRKKHAKYGSSVSKVKEFLAKYDVGDKVKVSDIRKMTGITSLTRILWVLKRDGFIDYQNPGSGKVSSYLTIRRSL